MNAIERRGGIDDGDYKFCSTSPLLKALDWVIVNSTRRTGALDFLEI
jgi:hypothetical protein